MREFISKLELSKKNEFSKQEDDVLFKVVQRGQDAKLLIENGTFKAIIESIENKMDELRYKIEYRPSGKVDNITDIGTRVVWFSGAISGLEEIFNTVNELVRDGNEASLILKERHKDKDKEK